MQLLYEELIGGKHILCAIKTVLITNQSSLYKDVIDQMKQVEEVSDITHCPRGGEVFMGGEGKGRGVVGRVDWEKTVLITKQ